MKERLHKCQQTERQRITFGKVSITSPLLQPHLHQSTSMQFIAYSEAYPWLVCKLSA